jgi:hypothetical protein
MNTVALNPYNNYSDTWDPIIDMTAMHNSSIGSQKPNAAANFHVTSLENDSWKLPHDYMRSKLKYDKDDVMFPLILESQFMNERRAYQDYDEKHLRHVAVESSQVVRNLQGGNNSRNIYFHKPAFERNTIHVIDNKPFVDSSAENTLPYAIKKYVYLGDDGHYKLRESVLPKYGR